MSSVNLVRRRIWQGMVATSLITPLAFFLGHVLYYVAVGYSRPWHAWLLSLGFVYLFGLPITFTAMVCLAWPWLRALVRWNKLAIGYVCAGAAAIGAFMFVLAVAMLNGDWPGSPSAFVEQVGLGFITGLLSGLIFSLAASVPVRPS